MVIGRKANHGYLREMAALIMAIFLSLTLPAEAASISDCKRVILTGDPSYPPFSWYENKVFRGSAIEIATIALTRAGLAYEIRYVGAFPQVLAAARKGQIDVIAELKNTPERRDYLSYSQIALFSNPVAIFTRANDKLVYTGWEDLIGLRGGITSGNKFGGGLDEFATGRLKVEAADSIGENFARLGNGRIDYFMNSYYPALSYLLRERRETEFKVLQPFVSASDNFVGWSKASPCIAKLAEFDTVLSAMVKSGEVRRIMDANLDQLRQSGKHGRAE